MRGIALVGAFALAGVWGCGDDEPGLGPEDAMRRTDATICDPISNTGCPPGFALKCSWLWQTTAEGFLDCGPEGDRPEGTACTVPSSGMDDCLAHLLCIDGFCEPICGFGPDPCTSPEICREVPGVFDGEYGVCSPP